ncbi:cation diffusion facilitator family transporter [Schinkia azotoformans MEV2011]|uniref:Cation diffusion facilitator family transporter n=1 Tax=Schinkia azotoformans MEV2011 TaxID=1348973 RepID=A0A072NLS7_SCHAZ|nr:cation diffusion facilitator family transporter [Schinkia azotoformans]KEF38431.1 cation diffusion facilitator family transporter [Schinkia azotoformans MEV2011]MEC1694173.1 cation diffusion facilitator family transporter [Schinkia azotoformans]MEC1724821.1 cation diffusion facilitator family transporter [Schinkia azotoformans]MEC1780901.1 cation diffusion facilitator family transporter [Schinkia azotoformans]MED4330573.1 cation diffusion facilitator family transporter [Schinkia azotoforman
MESYENLKAGEKGAWLSIITYIFLSVSKLLIGFLGNSEALLADGLNNSTDVVASIAVLVGLKIARKPPDKNHHYGHFRAETIASLIAAFIMISVGIQVIIEGVKSLTDESNVVPDMFTGWVALICSIIMFLVYCYNINLAKKINSQSIKAAAKDNLSDSLVSIGAFIGISGSQFGFFWLDTVTAILVGIIIIKTAIEIFKEAVLELTDGFEIEELEQIRETVSNNPDIKKVKSIKARMHGNQTFVDIIIVTDQTLNVFESHQITEEIEKSLMEKHQIQNVHIHIEPQ